MSELPLNALRAFAMVYAHGGVRAAAQSLGVAHSAVSRHLSELQRWLGVALIEGDRRALRFTPQGEALGHAAVRALEDLTRAVAAVREEKSSRSLTVATTSSFAVCWLLPRLPALEQIYPWLEVSVLVDQKLLDLNHSEADLAIRMGGGDWRRTLDGAVRAEVLMDDVLYPVMSPNYWEQQGRPRQAADLLHARLLHDRDPNAAWMLWRDAFGPAQLNVSAGPRFASSELLQRAAMQGQGVALARHRLVAEEVAAGVLVRPCGESQLTVPQAYWLLTAPSAKASGEREAVKVMRSWLLREAARQPLP